MFNKKKDFIISLGTSLHSCGASADDIESYLQSTITRLNLQGSVLSTPNFLIFSLKNDEGEDRIFIEKLPFSMIHLKKLVLIEILMNDFLMEKITLEEVTARLRLVQKLSPISSYPALFLSFALHSFSSCIFLGGNLRDCFISLTLGFLTGLFSLLEFFPLTVIFFQAIASFSISTLLILLQKQFPDLNTGVILLASLIGLFPGLGITLSVSELAKQHLLSGTMRLMNAFTSLLMLVFGTFIASNLFSTTFTQTNYTLHPKSLQLLFALVAGFASNRMFRGRVQDIPWMILSCSLSFIFTKMIPLNSFLTIFITGLFISFYSQIFSTLSKKPPLLFILPSIILLLPGALSFRITNDLFMGNFQGALAQLSLLFLTLTSLVFGLLIGQIFSFFQRYIPKKFS